MIIVKLQGGLGNQMFQYAFAKLVSSKMKTDFCLDTRYLLDKSLNPKIVRRDFDLAKFNIKKEYYKDFWSYPLQKYLVPVIEKVIKLSPITLKRSEMSFFVEKNIEHTIEIIGTDKLSNQRDYYFSGYFQTFFFAEQIIDELRTEFVLVDRINDKFEYLLEQIRQNDSICLHVRRGDYVGNSLYDVLEEGYYNRALIEMIKHVLNPHVYIFSDDITWCKENIILELPYTFVDTEKSVEIDFELMKSCNHFIIPNSTFSWWAAFLSNRNNKMVITPKLWLKGYVGNELVPQNWKRI